MITLYRENAVCLGQRTSGRAALISWKMLAMWILMVLCSGGCSDSQPANHDGYFELSSQGSQSVCELDTEEMDLTDTGSVKGDLSGEESVLSEDMIRVHVCGAVNRPGVYELTAQARVQDAIVAAGGASDDAALDFLNRAARLYDGCKLIVPAIEQVSGDQYGLGADLLDTTDTKRWILDGEVSSHDPDHTQEIKNQATGGSLININTADEQQLVELPGIGEGKAKKIVAYREENGSFSCIEDLMEVQGIGEATFQGLKNRITV